jgi:hypothetical protein
MRTLSPATEAVARRPSASSPIPAASNVDTRVILTPMSLRPAKRWKSFSCLFRCFAA